MAFRKRLFLCFLVLAFLDFIKLGVECRWSFNDEEDLEFEKQLKILNKPPVKTFQSQSGHFYDCIDIYKQPAFDNPLLKDHKLQMSPSSLPKGKSKLSSESRPFTANSNFRRNITCPSGTVLIRRTTKNDLVYAKTLQNHIKRPPASFQPKRGPNDGSHYAVMKTEWAKYYGSHAKLYVYGFPNLTLDQATISQIWLIGGADGDEDKVNTVQAGWHVYPSQQDGDSLTHLSTFWTADGYKTGCFNLNCLGFIVRSPFFGPGSEITELSTYGGIQESIELTIFKDQKTGNWWLTYGQERSFVGYWPKELFNNMDKATEVDWGGAVYSPFSQPSPPMGSGHLVYEGRNKTCYFLNLELINENNKLYKPLETEVSVQTTTPRYYDIDHDFDSTDGMYIRYGGPGGFKR